LVRGDDLLLKFVFFTDPHVTNHWPESRTDNFLEAILNKIRWVVDFANEERAHILIGGDLIDKYNTNPEVINMLIEELRRARKRVFGIIGNHDVYGQNWEVISKVILGAIFASGTVNLLTLKPTVLVEGNVSVQLTGANYIPDIDKHKELYRIKKLPDVGPAIHLVHGFLVNQNWPTFDHSQYTVLHEVTTDADITCTGHEHHGYGIEEVDGHLFTNPGALGRVSASEGEIKRVPKVTLIKCYPDHVEALLFNVPARPGSDILSRERLEEIKQHNEMLNVFKDSLQNERLSCNIHDVFEAQARGMGVSDAVRERALRAFEVFDGRNV
jgi:DNA repair exonuclease SbcCD nuclease subunit